MKRLQGRGAAIVALMLPVAACGSLTPAQTVAVSDTAQTVLVTGAACAADAPAIGSKTLVVARTLAADPTCSAALGALVAAGAAASAIVTVVTPAAP
jgi:hypothetical protein